MVKLTEAQRRELAKLARADYPVGYSDDYKPIRRLWELGYVDRDPGKYSPTYAINDAGRAAVADGGRDEQR